MDIYNLQIKMEISKQNWWYVKRWNLCNATRWFRSNGRQVFAPVAAGTFDRFLPGDYAKKNKVKL